MALLGTVMSSGLLISYILHPFFGRKISFLTPFFPACALLCSIFFLPNCPPFGGNDFVGSFSGPNLNGQWCGGETKKRRRRHFHARRIPGNGAKFTNF